jgi:alanyl-tRNA synthetase
MRRAILQGRQTLGLDPGFLLRFSDVVTELMGGEYHELSQQRDAIHMWLASEVESFGHTLDDGLKRLEDLIARAKDADEEGISADDAFLLHDTYGFPIDLTIELTAEHDLGVDRGRFDELMGGQRERARRGAGRDAGQQTVREHAQALAGDAGFETEFLGYETTELETTVGAVDSSREPASGRVLVKLVESPFYPTGGGQVADSGYVECESGDCRARVDDVLRVGDDQVLALVAEQGSVEVGERVRARVDRSARHATECNHTATHLLHAALRGRLGTHVRQAGSYVGPDKLRFDFTHGSALTPEELHEIEDQVNGWILQDQPVHALTTTLDEAKRLGAMALFGEKYGDVVRMVEVGDGSYSRELCGGTHVRSTAAVGVFKVLSETSSAANVRRIEALTGPEAVKLLRDHDAELSRAAGTLRVSPTHVADTAERLRGQLRELERAARSGAGGAGGGAVDLERLVATAAEHDGARVLAATVSTPDMNALLDLADRLKGKLADAVIVLGSAGEEHVDLVASVAPSLVERGVRAGEIVKVAAAVVGGGGGGRDTLARAGGREPAKLPDALAAARDAIDAALAS